MLLILIKRGNYVQMDYLYIECLHSIIYAHSSSNIKIQRELPIVSKLLKLSTNLINIFEITEYPEPLTKLGAKQAFLECYTNYTM